MFGYIGDLRTMTSGRAQFSMEFSYYAPCPKNIFDDVIAKAKTKEQCVFLSTHPRTSIIQCREALHDNVSDDAIAKAKEEVLRAAK